MIQGSPEWYAARLGKVTASRVADVVAKTRTGWGAMRANYRAELLSERLTGVAAERFTNREMEWGKEKEPDAKAAYEFLQDVDVESVGFVDHPTIAMAGASPDGLIGVDGLIEIKCPNTSTHLDTLLGESIPQKYVQQMQWQMACTGRLFCDFVSYDPRVPEEMQVFIHRFRRDDQFIADLEFAVEFFLREIATMETTLRSRYLKVA